MFTLLFGTLIHSKYFGLVLSLSLGQLLASTDFYPFLIELGGNGNCRKVLWIPKIFLDTKAKLNMIAYMSLTCGCCCYFKGILKCHKGSAVSKRHQYLFKCQNSCTDGWGRELHFKIPLKWHDFPQVQPIYAITSSIKWAPLLKHNKGGNHLCMCLEHLYPTS